MAAENMADILVYEINGLSRPEYLSRQVVNLVVNLQQFFF
jgi:hypothetical protein